MQHDPPGTYDIDDPPVNLGTEDDPVYPDLGRPWTFRETLLYGLACVAALIVLVLMAGGAL